MERLVREGKLDAVLDLTTTEICDLITGGVMSADPDRLDAAIQTEIPCVISMVSPYQLNDIQACISSLVDIWTRAPPI